VKLVWLDAFIVQETTKYYSGPRRQYVHLSTVDFKQ